MDSEKKAKTPEVKGPSETGGGNVNRMSMEGLEEFLESEVEIPVDVVSVGPGREQTIWINSIF